MNFIVHQVGQLQHVDVAHRNLPVERLAGAPVVKDGLAVVGEARFGENLEDVFLVSSVKNGGSDRDAQCFGRPPEVGLQNLSDIHPGRDSKGIEHDLHLSPVREKGHILFGHDAGDDPLVAVAAGHLIPFRYFPFLGDVDPYQLVHPGREFVALFPGKNLDVHYNAGLTVGHPQGGVAYLAGLFAKNSPQQALLGGKFSFPFRGDLPHQDVAGAHLGPYPDDPPDVQIPQGILPYIGDVAGDFLRAEFGIPRFRLILLNMNRGKDIFLDHLLAEQNGVLVVVALPGEKGGQDISSQGNLPQVGAGTVGDDFPPGHFLAFAHNGMLVDTGTLVRTFKFLQQVNIAPVAVERTVSHLKFLAGAAVDSEVGTVGVLLPPDHDFSIGHPDDLAAAAADHHRS